MVQSLRQHLGSIVLFYFILNPRSCLSLSNRGSSPAIIRTNNNNRTTPLKQNMTTLELKKKGGGDGIPQGIIAFFAQVAEGCTNLDDDFCWEVKMQSLGMDLVQDKTKLIGMCSKITKSIPDMSAQVISSCCCSDDDESNRNHEVDASWRKVVIQRSGTFNGEPLVLGNMPPLQPTGKFVKLPLEEHLVLVDKSSGRVIRAKTTAQNPTLYDALISTTESS